ncbi:MAG: hypothetical protein WC081_00550 [Candidatus Ratteibacteria bacterium]|jgi:hypothetical protein
MAQKSGKGKGKKPVSAIKKKVMPVKKTAAKKKEKMGKKPAILKKVVKTVKTKEVKEIKEAKKIIIVPQEFRMNIRCRSCSFVDGYIGGEKACHNCKNEIYEIDKI